MFEEKKSPTHRLALKPSGSSRMHCLLTALIPSFLLPFFSRGGHHTAPAKVSPTAWLDGMRGYAAFFVFLRHYEFAYHRKGAFVYGTVEDPNWPNENRHFLQLPIIRLINAGEAMVCVFFVISGYALSLKSLKLMRRRSHGELLRTLASSVFRRPFRLFLPCIASTLLIFVALRLGMCDYANSISEDEEVFRSTFLGWSHEPQPHIYATFYEQAWDYLYATRGLFDIMTHKHWPFHGYDIHLWTIPVEFRCSMVLFLTIAGLSLVRSKVRVTVLSVLLAASFQFDAWELGLFWGGMLLAEASLIQQQQQQQQQSTDSSPRSDETIIPIFLKETGTFSSSEPSAREAIFGKKSHWYSIFLISLILLSTPPQKTEFAPFYSTLLGWVPPGMRQEERNHFWMAIGAMLVVWSTNNEASLQKPFSCALGRYLGNISFALYLVHGFVNHTLGYSVVYYLWEHVTGKDTFARYEMGFVLGGFVVIPAAIWAADLFWRFVDVPVVKFARALENKMVALGDEDEWE